MLPAEVEKLTAGALVFEHSTTDTAAPDEAETRRRAGLRQTYVGCRPLILTLTDTHGLVLSYFPSPP